MKKIYQVFISSTYIDLKEERAKVLDAILSMHHFPIGMEMFNAADENQWNSITKAIDTSDCYVVIIGRRYGSTFDSGKDKGKSYTQKEFEYAKQKNIPILAFILDSNSCITSKSTDVDMEKKSKLDNFVKRIQKNHTTEEWSNGDDLAAKVVVALHNEFEKNRMPGYIRLDTSDNKIKQVCTNSNIKTYPNLDDAIPDLISDIECSSFLDFMGLQGSNFVGEDRLAHCVRKKESLAIRYLIQYPFSEQIRQRLNSLPFQHNNNILEAKWRSIYRNILELKHECTYEYNFTESVHIRFFDGPLLARLFFTEKHLYLNYYEKGKVSTECEVYRYESDSPTYETYKMYFHDQWIKAQRSLPTKKIPEKYIFLKDSQFKVTPSLVINICADCDMNCLYCPEGANGRKIGGENLLQIKKENYCNIGSVTQLVKKFGEHVKNSKEKPILRITGGEPLFGSDNRCRTAAVLKAAQKEYSRIVLCTNGLSFEEAYSENQNIWNSVKKKMLLKISLDTLCEDKFQRLTGSPLGTLDRVKSAIVFASKKGFKVELNVVATNENLNNLNDVMDLFKFAIENQLVGIKILTINDFGGNVKFEQSDDDQLRIRNQLCKLINTLVCEGYEERSAFLNDNKGIEMRRFVYHYDDDIGENDMECTLTIVDHHNTNRSLTPTRTFAEFCKSCKFYPENVKSNSAITPCATGVMSITMRADGLLSPCRLLTDSINTVNISQKNSNYIWNKVCETLKKYECCWHSTCLFGDGDNE